MTTFTNFSNILPDPTHKIGVGGQEDATGTEGPGFASIKLSSMEPMMDSNTNSQRLAVASGTYHRWQLDINYNPMTCLAFHPVYSFVLYKEATLIPFFVYIPTGQIATDKLTVGAAAKGDSTLIIDDTSSAPISPSPTDIFIIDDAAHTKVYMVTRVETPSEYYTPWGSPGAGNERIHFTPPLQKAVSGGATVLFTDVPMKVVSITDKIDYSLNDKGLFSFSLKFEEVST